MVVENESARAETAGAVRPEPLTPRGPDRPVHQSSLIRGIYPRALYRPPSRWPIARALFIALALHALAIFIAALESEIPPPADVPMGEQIAEVVFESGPPEPVTPDEPQVEPVPVEAPPALAEAPEFVEENATPPPERVNRSRSATPLARPRAAGIAGPVSMASAKAVALNAPRPEYPVRGAP